MKALLIAFTAAVLIAGCNSKKSTTETEPMYVKDSAVPKMPDTTKTGMTNETGTDTPDFGGVGELSLDLSQAKVIELLGQPGSKSKAQEWGADGLIHQDWIYKGKGISLNMSNEKGQATQVISSITINSPCTYKTKMNVGIGSMYEEVKAAYNKDIDMENTDDKTITVGSVYGGIIFSFGNDGKAASIFVGAAAE